MRRRGVPCGCTDNGGNGGCCGLKEKLAILWDRTIGSILRINGVSPDGDGDFTIEAGSNIAISETGTGNGLRIDTTGGVSYYDSGDAYVNVDNNDLEITVNAGVTGGLALQDDLDTVTGAVSNILDGTTTVPKATDATNATNATNATYLGSNSANVGSDSKPVKIVNGQAVAVTDDLAVDEVEWITCTAGTNITIYNISSWRYNKIVHIDVDLVASASIPASQVVLTIPSAYLPPLDHTNPFGVVDDYNNPSVHYPYGIGWNKGGIFFDLTMPSGGRVRISHTYVKN